MKSRYAIFILTGVMTVMLPSCASTYDPAYQQLVASADTLGDSGKIVGIWHRTATMGGMYGVSGKQSWSLLFQKSGSGYLNIYAGNDSMNTFFGGKDERNLDFQWRYQGNGVWTADAIGNLRKAEWRISGDQLLFKYDNGSGYLFHWVLTRVE